MDVYWLLEISVQKLSVSDGSTYLFLIPNH